MLTNAVNSQIHCNLLFFFFEVSYLSLWSFSSCQKTPINSLHLVNNYYIL